MIEHMGTGQKSTGDTLARCDNLARCDTLERCHFSTKFNLQFFSMLK